MPLDLSEYKLTKKDEKEHDIIFHLSTKRVVIIQIFIVYTHCRKEGER